MVEYLILTHVYGRYRWVKYFVCQDIQDIQDVFDVFSKCIDVETISDIIPKRRGIFQVIPKEEIKGYLVRVEFNKGMSNIKVVKHI